MDDRPSGRGGARPNSGPKTAEKIAAMAPARARAAEELAFRSLDSEDEATRVSNAAARLHLEGVLSKSECEAYQTSCSVHLRALRQSAARSEIRELERLLDNTRRERELSQANSARERAKAS